MGHKVILLGGELIRNIFGHGNSLEFLPWIKNPNLLMLALGFEPTTSRHSVVVIKHRLAHRLNHLATEDSYDTSFFLFQQNKNANT